MSKRATKKTPELVADVCLYGTRETGFAFLARDARTPGELIAGGWKGEGAEERPGTFPSLTEAVWSAATDLRARGVLAGDVVIFAPGGATFARVPISSVPSVGSMQWQPVPAVAS